MVPLTAFLGAVTIALCGTSHPKNFLWLGKFAGLAYFILIFWVCLGPVAFSSYISREYLAPVLIANIISMLMFYFLSFFVPQDNNVHPIVRDYILGRKAEIKPPHEFDDETLRQIEEHDLYSSVDDETAERFRAEVRRRGLDK